MAKVYTTIGIDEQVKVLWKEFADRDGRSMAGYIEWIIRRESEKKERTLEDIYKKLEDIYEKNEEYFTIICNKLDEINEVEID